MATTQTTQANEKTMYQIIESNPYSVCRHHFIIHRDYCSELDLLDSIADCSRCTSWQGAVLSYAELSQIKYRHSQLKAF